MEQILDRHRTFINLIGRSGEILAIISTRDPIEFLRESVLYWALRLIL
jgi:hypothetical protein